jgi:hypothetical protein
MNIQSLLEKIQLFEKLVIESGFKRDVTGFKESIAPQQNRQNLQLFQDIAGKIESYLNMINESDLPESLKSVLPTESIRPFTETDHLEKLNEILTDTELDTNQYFSKLNKLLNNLQSQIETNHTELNRLKDIFQNYADFEQKEINSEEQAVISLIFKDLKTTTSLKEFSKVLHKWNTTLLIYHQLLTSEAPKDIEIVEVQNGSIDVLVNIDVDIAVDLLELIKLGFKVFGGYLLYKSRTKEIIATFFGNKKLILQEKERENEMLNNIYKAIEAKILEQHKLAKKEDKAIDGTAIKVKVKEVADTLSEHIVKGNDIKLLAAPEEYEELEEEAEEIRISSISNRRALKNLTEEDRIKLIEKYEIKDKDEPNA